MAMEGILSRVHLESLILKTSSRKEVEQVLIGLNKNKWRRHRKIVIFPFRSENLGPVSYDVSCGNSAFSTSTGELKELSNDEPYLEIFPQESFLVMTQEYIILPLNVTGIVTPKHRLVREGLVITPARIDPGWYGKLTIHVINTSNKVFRMRMGERIAAFLFYRTKTIPAPLGPDDTPFLGQEKIQIETSHLREWKEAIKVSSERKLEELAEITRRIPIGKLMESISQVIVNYTIGEVSKTFLKQLDKKSEEIEQLREEINQLRSELASLAGRLGVKEQ
jgi:deoxycytidine triphosphate deaminase